MKIHTPPPPLELVRVTVRKTGHKTESLTLEDTTPAQFLAWAKLLIETQQISPFEGGYKTAIEAREYAEKQNGKTTSISFHGLDPEKVKALIIEKLSK